MTIGAAFERVSYDVGEWVLVSNRDDDVSSVITDYRDFPPRFCSKKRTCFLTVRKDASAEPILTHTSRSLTNWIVFKHAQRPMGSWSAEGLEIARHSHGYEPHGDGA